MRNLTRNERRNLCYIVALVALIALTLLIPDWTGVYIG